MAQKSKKSHKNSLHKIEIDSLQFYMLILLYSLGSNMIGSLIANTSDKKQDFFFGVYKEALELEALLWYYADKFGSLDPLLIDHNNKQVGPSETFKEELQVFAGIYNQNNSLEQMASILAIQKIKKERGLSTKEAIADKYDEEFLKFFDEYYQKYYQKIEVENQSLYDLFEIIEK